MESNHQQADEQEFTPITSYGGYQNATDEFAKGTIYCGEPGRSALELDLYTIASSIRDRV